jgi:Domain of unknown function (DUF4166)
MDGAGRVVEAVARAKGSNEGTRRDWRIRNLVGPAAWASLPVAVRERFSKPLAGGAVRLYRGRVIETRIPWAGRLLAQAGRLIGAPLPLLEGATGPSTVAVVEDAGVGGQVWTRVYPQPGRFPQVVNSAKRFAGPTGLEEYVGYGIGMTLAVSVEDRRLIFRSQAFFLEGLGLRVTVPAWLTPGAMEIVHTQETEDEFSFLLTIHHPVFGLLLRQLAWFCDT